MRDDFKLEPYSTTHVSNAVAIQTTLVHVLSRAISVRVLLYVMGNVIQRPEVPLVLITERQDAADPSAANVKSKVMSIISRCRFLFELVIYFFEEKEDVELKQEELESLAG